MNRSEYDKRRYYEIKADPIQYATFLERKRRERSRKKDYETSRKRRWRAANPEHAQRIRKANHAVEAALKSGQLVRPEQCSACPTVGKIEAHHHKGYAPEFWLDVQWLCVMCHRKADRKQNKADDNG